MNKKITRPAVLTAILLCLMFFAFKSGYLPFKPDSSIRSDLSGASGVDSSKSTTKKTDLNRLDALSEDNIVSLRTNFFRLNPEQAQWKSLPESSNDSLWMKGQQRRLHSVLKDVEFDTIVLPIQQANISIDKTARIMAARFLADDISNSTNKNVMPVEYVYQLLGDNNSHFSDQDIRNLQQQYGVKEIVYLFLRKDILDNKKMFLSASLTSEDKVKDTHYIHIDKPNDEVSLSSILSQDITQLTESLYGLSEKIELEKSELEGDFTFPDSLESLVSKNSAIETALHLQLLGLTISEEQRLQERNRYFERSLLALRYVSNNVPELKVLKARALFYLFRRPEAIKILSSANSVEELALLSFMNGNFYELEKHYAELKQDLFQAISYIELKQLADSYQISNDEYSMADYGDSWSVLLDQASNDNDDWERYYNDEFFYSLKGLYPDFDTVYGETFSEKTMTSQLNNQYNSGNLLFDSAISKLLKSKKLVTCCSFKSFEITDMDLLQYYRNLGLVNILRDLDLKINLQVVNTPTSELFEESSSILDGDIKFLSYKVDSLSNEIKRTPTSNHPKLLKALMDNLKLVYSTTRNSDILQSWAASTFYDNLENYKKYYEFNENNRKEIIWDFNDWPSNLRRSFDDWGKKSYYYEYSHDSFSNIKKHYKYSKKEDEKAFLLEELKNRYDGHPDKTAFLSDVIEEKGDNDGAISILEKAVLIGDNSWEVYSKLADQYLAKGSFKEASETYLKYPGFNKNSANNRVILSNVAYEAGSNLYWRGEYELAKPLYEISANLETGSSASMTSAQRLAYIDGDLVTALVYARSSATRYSSHYRYRDLLSLMHSFDLSENADVLFSELAPRSQKPLIWSSALVGDRKKSVSLNELISKLTKYAEVNDSQRELISRYIVMFMRTDRRINKDEITEDIKRLLSKPINGKTRRLPVSTNSLAMYLNPEFKETLKVSPLPGITLYSNKLSDDCPTKKYIICGELDPKKIPSRYDLFIDAYSELELSNYKAALEKFIEYDIYYSVNDINRALHSELLPYIAMAASKTDKSDAINKYLNEKYDHIKSRTFDSYLAKAVADHSKGESLDSIDSLNKAFLLIPYTEYRTTSPWYQLLEVSEWLFDETGEKKFIQMALKWAESYQVIDPVHAWSYAFEAKYSEDDTRKLRAIGIADYLDPKSKWLSAVSNKLKLKARKWMKTNNPFDIEKKLEKREVI